MSDVTNLYPAPGMAPTGGVQQMSSAHAAQTTVATSGTAAGGTSATGTTASAGNGQGAGAAAPVKASRLAAFEGFLQKAGHIAGVVLTEIVKYAIPVASVVSVADPSAAPAVAAFMASVKLVQSTVITTQQRWAAEGSAANQQKLADVLEIVEQPIVTMFAQAGLQVDTAYVINLVKGVVAILNAQPAAVLPAA